MRKSLAWLFALTTTSSYLFGEADAGIMLRWSQQPQTPTQPAQQAPPTGPWFTGPLLTPSGHVVPGGYVNIEPYIFVNVITGVYNRRWDSVKVPKFYNVNYELPIQIGLTDWMDFAINPQFSYNSTRKVSSFVINDLSTSLDFQLVKDTLENRRPGIKFYIQEVWPVGRYQKLKPDNLGTDVGGVGSFQTSVGFVITRTLHINKIHYLALRFNPFITIPSHVPVNRLSVYGGGEDTRGTIKPGLIYSGLFGLEYSLTQNWALAFDAYGVYKNKVTFSGKSSLPVGRPSSMQFSLAPAVEYNFSSSVGIIGGAWFTIAGRNSLKFASGVIALNYFGPIFGKKKAEDTYQSSGGGGSP